MRIGLIGVLLVALSLGALVAAWPQERPLTKSEVFDLTLADKPDKDEAAAREVERRGIDFEPSEQFLKFLSAKEVLLEALRKAGQAHAVLVEGKRALDIFAVFELLINHVSSARVAELIQERGIDFSESDEVLKALRNLGGSEELLDLVRRTAKQEDSLDWAYPDPPLLEHARMVEADYRARLRTDPKNWALRYVLGDAYLLEGKGDDRIRLFQEWVRLMPDDVLAHKMLAYALVLPAGEGDWSYNEQATRELFEAVRIDPHDCEAHGLIAEGLDPEAVEGFGLGPAAARAQRAQLAQYRAAIRAHPPDCTTAYSALDASVEDARDLVSKAPNSAATHWYLARQLVAKGDKPAALEELKTAVALAPNDSSLREELERLQKEVKP